MKRFLKSQLGQTAVEYLLVTAVSISLGILFTKKASKLLVDDENSFIQAYITRYNKLLGNDKSVGRRYSRFTLQRYR